MKCEIFPTKVSLGLEFFYAKKITRVIGTIFFAFCLRCGQPGQQQGLRFPLIRSSHKRSICSFLVSRFFTIVVQHIHSLRARSVRPVHFSSTFGFEANISFKSEGTLCIVPVVIVFLVIFFSIFH